MTNWGQKLDKICQNTYKMWQTGDKICQNTYKMWQTGDKICHYKNTISVRYVTITLMYQTIVTKFVTSGTKMWQNLNLQKTAWLCGFWHVFKILSHLYLVCHMFVPILSRPKTPSYQRLWGFWHQRWQNFRNY